MAPNRATYHIYYENIRKNSRDIKKEYWPEIYEVTQYFYWENDYEII